MSPGKLLILLGTGLIVLGVLWTLGGRIPWLGRLPGDLRFQWNHTTVFLPLGSCVLLSLVVSLLLWFFRR